MVGAAAPYSVWERTSCVLPASLPERLHFGDQGSLANVIQGECYLGAIIPAYHDMLIVRYGENLYPMAAVIRPPQRPL
jgi:hypothetical protein